MQLSKILSITIIHNAIEYEKVIIKYNKLIEIFDISAKETIYSPKSSGEEETENENYYCHVLICYLGKKMK